MIKLIIARHGNTFEAGQTPTRVGARTDLPLVPKGLEQGAALGRSLMEQGLPPDMVFTSSLKRTRETAIAALSAMRGACDKDMDDIPVEARPLFNEIDYGPDENKPEADVIARIGAEAIKRWDEEAVAPEGWEVDIEAIKTGWLDFAADLTAHYDGKTILVVTSNGTARFAPIITDGWEEFVAAQNIKLSTGAYGLFEYEEAQGWRLNGWNIKPGKGALKNAV